jgi:hypothetical protein
MIISIQVISLAPANAEHLSCKPEVIQPGGKTIITVTSEKGGIGFIKVIQPNDEFSVVGIIIPKGGTVSRIYPDDFMPQSVVIDLKDIMKIELNPPLKIIGQTKERLTLLLQSLVEQQEVSTAQPGSTQNKGKYVVKVFLLGQISSQNFEIIEEEVIIRIEDPTPSPTPSPEPSPTPSPTPSPEPSPTPTPTPRRSRDDDDKVPPEFVIPEFSIGTIGFITASFIALIIMFNLLRPD